MNTLFISSYNAKVIIAVLKNGKLDNIYEEESNKNHSEVILPSIKNVLSSSNILVSDLSDIIVVNGPGSFTGVRLGVTVAKTLAYTLNIPIKTITSLEAMAVSVNEDNKVILLSDSKGKYIATFENNILVGEMEYKKDTILDNNYQYNTYENVKLDIEKIYDYVKNKNSINPHLVNPIYIKEIDALNGR